jgi:hypothetical protein
VRDVFELLIFLLFQFFKLKYVFLFCDFVCELEGLMESAILCAEWMTICVLNGVRFVCGMECDFVCDLCA